MNPNPAAVLRDVGSAGDARAALRALVDEVHGPIAPPPPPTALRTHLLHRAVVARWHGAMLETWRVAWGEQLGDAFTLMLMRPAVSGPCPTLVTGDACWAYWLDGAVITTAAIDGVALAWFNRTELHADPLPEDRAAIDALTAQPPLGMSALAAWAWALHRAVDALEAMPTSVDRTRIGVAGHSRGGKAALLAAALDERIALAAINNAGALGVASPAVTAPGIESVTALVEHYPHWVGPKLRERVARGERPVPDMQPIVDAIAPRTLLVTQARDDAWANPAGVRETVLRASTVFAARGATAALRLVERAGGHAQTLADGLAAVDAMCALRRSGDTTRSS